MVKLPTQSQDLGDVRLAYRESGAGPALILLHGNSESKSIFSAYQQSHFSRFHTIAVDSRGHGETISNDTCYSIGQYSADVIQLCRARGISQAGVIGYSDGGNIALFLASREPKLFNKDEPSLYRGSIRQSASRLIKSTVGTRVVPRENNYPRPCACFGAGIFV